MIFFFSYLSETVWTFYFFNWGEVLSLSSCWVKKWQHYFVLLTLSAVCSFFGAPKVFCGKKERDLVERKVLGRSQLETAACQSERGGVEHPFWISTLARRNPINKFTFLSHFCCRRQWLKFWWTIQNSCHRHQNVDNL